MSEKIRVMLADDHNIFRSGLKALLATEPDIDVVGEAADGPQALERCVELAPEVLVLDLVMPGPSGLEMLPRIVESCPGCRVLVLTMLPEDQYLIQVLKAGGAGYIPKSAADSELTDAIRAVHQGRAYLRTQDLHLLFSEYLRSSEQSAPTRDSMDALSSREREVLGLTARGLSSREIGDRLFISPKTVDTYRQRLMEKLGLDRRSDLIAFAISRGLLNS